MGSRIQDQCITALNVQWIQQRDGMDEDDVKTQSRHELPESLHRKTSEIVKVMNRHPKKQIKPSMVMSSTGWEPCVYVSFGTSVSVSQSVEHVKKRLFLLKMCKRVTVVRVTRNTNKHIRPFRAGLNRQTSHL